MYIILDFYRNLPKDTDNNIIVKVIYRAHSSATPKLLDNKLGNDDNDDDERRLVPMTLGFWSSPSSKNGEHLKAKPNCPMTTANYSQFTSTST
ncbi:unnamed protein product [Brugia pahangi]|uniref:Ovule protein n=1 Tax=Brugia pahangi TaxID=6280 RepID=A0A0N4SZY0_BRUPA|nr:unnamed protein product [Brugia pahangi]